MTVLRLPDSLHRSRMLTAGSPRARRETDSTTAEDQGPRNPLDEEVAIRLLGYRWVAWKSLDSFPLPAEEEGRFLALPEGPRASELVPAGSDVPLAKEPHRYVPMFSTDMKAAFSLAVAAGLFVSANAFLTVSAWGEWAVHEEDGRVLGAAESLPEALCRAALAWHGLHSAGGDDAAER